MGGLILIISVVWYLDGFSTINQYFKEMREEARLKREINDPTRKFGRQQSSSDSDPKQG